MDRNFWKTLDFKVEIPVLLLFFSLTFCDSVKSNLIIFRTCYVTLGFNKEECSLLGSQNPDNKTAGLEKIVEPYAAVVTMATFLTEGFGSAVMCLFLGPWSDRFGRKPVVIGALIGFFLNYVLMAVLSTLEVSPWSFLMCSLPVCSTGGLSSFMTATLCHITDSTTEKNRGMKMGVVEATLYKGVFLGTISSSYVFAATNYATVFFIAAICCFFALMFTIFCISESLPHQEYEGHFKTFFNLSNIKVMVKTTFKSRQNYARGTILSCLLMMVLVGVTFTGNESLTFLFLREKFHWSLRKFTLFSAYTNVCVAFGTLIGVYVLHKLLKLPETVLMLVSLISALNGAVMIGLAQSDWLVYIAPVARLLGGIFGPMVRLLTSKIIPKEEVGKVFALFTASQFLFGVLSSPIYTFIYKETISTDPGIFNFVNAGIIVFQMCILIGVIVVRTANSRAYVLIQEDDNEQLVNAC